ncbi:hypothetical protein ACHAXR_001990 [Thalassiosira sp. AJA248-18]
MRSSSFLVAAIYAAGFAADAFQPGPSTTPVAASRSATALYEYIPSGFNKASWAKFKKEEADKKKAANLGRMGPKGFQSRSMQSFQEALERGEAAHLLPMENAAERLRKGEIKKEDIPYMQRGGAWDNSDVKGAKKKKWLNSDNEYAGGGFKKSQSVSIFGEGQGLDWTGKRGKTGPTQGVKLGKNYKPPTVSQIKGAAATEKPKKKMFGLF